MTHFGIENDFVFKNMRIFRKILDIKKKTTTT